MNNVSENVGKALVLTSHCLVHILKSFTQYYRRCSTSSSSSFTMTWRSLCVLRTPFCRACNQIWIMNQVGDFHTTGCWASALHGPVKSHSAYEEHVFVIAIYVIPGSSAARHAWRYYRLCLLFREFMFC